MKPMSYSRFSSFPSGEDLPFGSELEWLPEARSRSTRSYPQRIQLFEGLPRLGLRPWLAHMGEAQHGRCDHVWGDCRVDRQRLWKPVADLGFALNNGTVLDLRGFFAYEADELLEVLKLSVW